MGVGSYLTDGRASMDSNKDPRERLLSMFGRANYSYKDRYMATVSFRREGSSKFGVNNRWGNFWAVSGGWRLSNEAFMRDVGWIATSRCAWVTASRVTTASGTAIRPACTKPTTCGPPTGSGSPVTVRSAISTPT